MQAANTQVSKPNPMIAGVILAGGQGVRMGGVNKALLKVNGRPLLDFILERAGGQVGPMLINVNADLDELKPYGLPLIGDGIHAHMGPLAGIYAAMEWLYENKHAITHLATFPCDGPRLPRDLVTRLEARLHEANTRLAIAAFGNRLHPTFALFSLSLRENIKQVLEAGDIPPLQNWATSMGAALVNWDEQKPDPFLNINTQMDMDVFSRQISSKALAERETRATISNLCYASTRVIKKNLKQEEKIP